MMLLYHHFEEAIDKSKIQIVISRKWLTVANNKVQTQVNPSFLIGIFCFFKKLMGKLPFQKKAFLKSDSDGH